MAAKEPAQEPEPPEQEYSDPKIQAESLMLRVLPREAYLSIAAHGYCEIQGAQNKYRLHRGSNTIVLKPDGSRYSACIVFEEAGAPSQDKLVMEYLLIKGDEQKYLSTANLSWLGTTIERERRPAPPQFRRRFGTPVWDGQIPPAPNRAIREPERLVTANMIVQDMLYLIIDNERMRDWHIPLYRLETHPIRPGTRAEILSIDLAFTEHDFAMPIDRFSDMFLRLPAEEIVRGLRDRATMIRATYELELPRGVYSAARYSDPNTGFSLRLVTAYAMTAREEFRRRARVDIGLVLAE